MDHSKSADGKLNTWVSEVVPQVLGYACTLVRTRQVAEDLVQDCCCRLLAKADVYNLPRDGTKLLYRSVTNACINWTQRQSPEVSLDQLQNSVSSGRRALSDSASSGPVQMAMQHELEQAIEAAMNAIPVDQRAAIELRSLGHSLVEVAEMLETSHGNARVLLHRARRALADRLKSYLEDQVR